MNLVTIIAIVIALLGGIFLALSGFVMKAIGRVPSAEGIAEMQK